MKKLVFLIGLVLCPIAKGMAQIPPELMDAIRAAVAEQAPKTDTSKADSTHVSKPSRLSPSALRDPSTAWTTRW